MLLEELRKAKLRIATKEEEMATKDLEIVAMSQMIPTLLQDMDDKDKKVEERDRLITAKDQLIQAKDLEILQLRQEIEAMQMINQAKDIEILRLVGIQMDSLREGGLSPPDKCVISERTDPQSDVIYTHVNTVNSDSNVEEIRTFQPGVDLKERILSAWTVHKETKRAAYTRND